jgi:hypothetical protein
MFISYVIRKIYYVKSSYKSHVEKLLWISLPTSSYEQKLDFEGYVEKNTIYKILLKIYLQSYIWP